jgi:hypothetical protein
MRQVSELALSMIVDRVFKKAIGADGRGFGEYTSRESTKGLGHWVAPDLPQPPSGRHLVTKAGWANYESFTTWKDSVYRAGLAPSRTKTFQKRGTLWKGLTIKALSMTKARITFTGKNRGASNARVSAFTMGRQSPAVLMLSPAEIGSVEEFLRGTALARWLDAAKIHQMGLDARAAMIGARRKLKKATKLAAQARAITAGGPAR